MMISFLLNKSKEQEMSQQFGMKTGKLCAKIGREISFVKYSIAEKMNV
jgi:hypothetical protein